MLNTNDENEKDEGLNLSDMINEYEEDSVLRNKIEALKAEKAQEEAQRLAKVEETSERSELSDTRDLPRYSGASVYGSTFLDAGATQEDEEEFDGDKTLVVMDNPIKHEFDDNESILYYGDHEVDAEEITEEDIEEFLGDEKVKKQREPMDPKKLNKIITYAISGVVSLCVLVGVGFGIKMAMDSFASEDISDPSDKPEIKDPTDKPEQEKPVTPPEKQPTDNGEESNSNAIRIAEINGSIKAMQQQVTDLNNAISTAMAEYKRLEKEVNDTGGLEDVYATKNAEYSNINNKVIEAKTVLDREKAALSAGTGTQESVDAATKTYDTINAAMISAKSEADNAKTALDNKKAEMDKKMKEQQGYTTQVTSIQLNIDNLQKELQSLQ